MTTDSNTSVIEWMQTQLASVLREVEASDYWRPFEDEKTPSKLVLAIMREVMLEIWSYQKRIDEAVFTAVGRLGSTIDEQGLIRSMIAVQIEETGHGTLALGDYIALGGDAHHARTRRPSPAAQALIGTVRHVSEVENPLNWLGYMYFFEEFTTIMTVRVAPILERHGYPEDRLRFMKLHAEEDIRHADMLANVIAECVTRYDGAEAHIKLGFEAFRLVYPHNIWRTACQRAVSGV